MSNQGSKLREFGEFRLLVRTRQLWFKETPLKLPEKALDVLVELTAANGKVVTREHLTSTIWDGENGAENSLAQAIHTLRKTFRNCGSPELIVTVPRRGYRFVGTIIETPDGSSAGLVSTPEPTRAVVSADAPEPQALDQEQTRHSAIPAARPASRSIRMRLAIFVAALLSAIFVSGLALWNFGPKRDGNGLGAPGAVAFLPLRTSGDVDEDLRLRITDSLITRLSEVREIRVRPLIAVKRFLDSGVEPLETGRNLEVDIVFDGNVQQTDEVLKVELRAISTKTGLEVWREQFVGERSRLLMLQDTISESILRSLRASGSGQVFSDISSKMTEIPEAYEHFLKGRYFVQLRTFEDIRRAISHFRGATEIDPTFAAAFVGLADAHFLLYDYNYEPTHENVRIANENIAIALGLDPNNDKAFVLQGHIKTRYEWDWAGAERSFEAAFRIRPDSADAFHRRGMMFLKLREFDKAESDIRKAIELEPMSLPITMNLGTVQFFTGKHQAALEQFRKAIELEQKLAAPKWYMARCLWQMGNINAAFKAYAEVMIATGEQELVARIDQKRLTAGNDDALRFWISEWKKAGVNNHSLAIISSYRKDKDETLSYLKRAVDSRHPWASSIYAEPEFAFLADEPEFQELISRLGLGDR